MAHIVADLDRHSGLRPELAGQAVKVVERQIVAGEVHSLLVLLPGRQTATKVAPRYVEQDEGQGGDSATLGDALRES
jgi:hypothetical protein